MIGDLYSKEDLQELDREHVWHPLTQHADYQSGAAPLIIETGEKSTVYDMDGRAYLDAAAGLWCVNVGYSHPKLIDAGYQQLRKLAYYPLTQSHPAAIKLGAKIASYLPHVPHVYFSNSGSEANEMAFKAARQYWKQMGNPHKTKIISRHLGYHGSTLGALSATGQPERKRDYDPLLPGFIQVSAPHCYRCPFSLSHPSCQLQCAHDFERRIEIEGADTVAAIIVEPIMAGGGILLPPPGYLQKLQTIARQNDVLLIIDEVVTGIGRTGSMFYHTELDLQPDIVTMAKGLASGYIPISATALSHRIFEAFLGEKNSGSHLRHVNTFSGHPVAAAVSLANFEVIEEEGLLDSARELGTYMLEQLKHALASHPLVGDIRGQGLLIGVELVMDRETKSPVTNQFMQQIARYLVAHNILAGKMTDVHAMKNNVLMFAPPLVITRGEIDRLVKTVADALANCANPNPIPMHSFQPQDETPHPALS